ncbi:MAG: hypothetical protein HWD84_04030 [Flavobacteriaceae bacterium]|jgi:hypothetical protein|nr:hypothetical protein [Flavobacteriaceae bacterium]NVJ71831.1 hypothetical protein [Flavobacteriaceae bacterium]
MKKCIFLGLLLLGLSCQNSVEKKELDASDSAPVIQMDSLPKIQPSELKFEDSTMVWNSLEDFHKRLSGFQTIKTVEDLRLFTEELIELETAIEEGEIPDLFNNDAVNSRLILIKTYLHQLHAFIELEQNLNKASTQLLEAHQSLLDKLVLLQNNANAPKISKDDLK